MCFYQELVYDIWREHPAEKGRLALLAGELLWSPQVTSAEVRPGAGTWLDTARTWAEPTFAVALSVFALVGLRLMPRRYLVLAAALLAYETAIAMLFMGATRYRVPWDFLLAVPAARLSSTWRSAYVAPARGRSADSIRASSSASRCARITFWSESFEITVE